MIPEQKPRYKWFKLGLIDGKVEEQDLCKLAQKYPDPSALATDHGSDSEKFVVDYLKALRTHVEHVLRNKLLQNTFASAKMEFMLTVPAMFADSTKEKMRACATKAGMGQGNKLHMITEPEAAALYAIDAMDYTLQMGDQFIICDAGGGTVDLISYKVTAIHPDVQLVEAAPGSGESCGSTFLNRIFYAFLQAKFGKVKGFDGGIMEEAMKQFDDVVKRSFRGSADESFSIHVSGLPDNANLGIRRGKFTLLGKDLLKIFDEVFEVILDLIRGQIKATKGHVRAIFLVGGFGSSVYLRESIRNLVKGSKTEVVQSPNGWTAVERGALMRLIAETSPTSGRVRIEGRRARKHYGFDLHVKFNGKSHDEGKRFWSPMEGEYRIYIMDWFIKKGTIVREYPSKTLWYYRHFPVADGSPSKVYETIWMYSDASGTKPPMYQTDGVCKLVNLPADLDKIPIKQIPISTGKDGEKYYDVKFSIKITFYSGWTEYELIYKGKSYGSVNAEYV